MRDHEYTEEEWAKFEKEWEAIQTRADSEPVPEEDPTIPLPPHESILQSLRDSQTQLEQASNRVEPIVRRSSGSIPAVKITK